MAAATLIVAQNVRRTSLTWHRGGATLAGAEKRKPHHDLQAFRATFSVPDALRITRAALQDAFALGFTRPMIVEVVQAMKRENFYKSMTALADNTKWQDVYRVPWGDQILYVKFTEERIIGFLLLSFKEK